MPYLNGKYSIFYAYLIRYDLKSLNAFLIFFEMCRRTINISNSIFNFETPLKEYEFAKTQSDLTNIQHLNNQFNIGLK